MMTDCKVCAEREAYEWKYWLDLYRRVFYAQETYNHLGYLMQCEPLLEDMPTEIQIHIEFGISDAMEDYWDNEIPEFW